MATSTYTCINLFIPADTDSGPVAAIGRDVGDDLAARDGQHKSAVVRERELVVLLGRGVTQRCPVVVPVVGGQPEAEAELREERTELERDGDQLSMTSAPRGR